MNSLLERALSLLPLSAQNYIFNLKKTKLEYMSAGIIQDGGPTYINNGSGNVTINACCVALFDNANYSGIANKYNLSPITETLTDGVVNYIIADYNSGNPIIRITTDVSVIDESSVIPIFTILRTGNYLHTINWDNLGLGLPNKLHQSIVKTERYRREYGLDLSEYGTRNLTLAAGKVWIGAHGVNLDAIASDTDNIFFYYHNAGAWTLSIVTQYNNTQYDNGTDLVELTTNRYAVNWVFRGVENQKHLYVILGSGDYTSTQAQAATVPAVPPQISSHAILVGKVIVQKSASTASAIQSAFATQFYSAGITNHDDLAGINQAAAGVTYGHINDTAQTIAGVKTFSDSPIVPTPTTDYQAATKKYVDDNAGGGGNGLPLFSPLFLDYIPTNASYVLSDGSSYVSGTVYSTAYNHLVADYNAASDTSEVVGGVTVNFRRAADGHKIIDNANVANYSNILSATGTAWYYVLDQVNTRFMLPFTNHFIQGGVTTAGSMAAYQAAGLPNITGDFYASSTDGTLLGSSLSSVSGAFYVGNSRTYRPSGTTSNGGNGVGFNAALSNSIYGSSTTVQPKSNKLGLYFVCGNSVANSYLIDANGLADRNLSNLTFVGEATFKPKGYIYNLLPSNATDVDHDITISAGECLDSANTILIKLLSALTKQIDATWAAGSNAGGLASGLTLAASTTYYLFLISNGTTVDAGFDTSLTAINLLAGSGYSYYRRVASLKTNASSNFVRFIAREEGNAIDFRFKTKITDVSLTTLSTTKAALTLSAPSNTKAKITCCYVDNDTTPNHVVIFEDNQDDLTIARSNATTLANSSYASIPEIQLYVNSSSQIFYKAEDTGAASFYINTLGYTDYRN